jgi:pimeloyl-ACP methyl ester carboxylesterase
MYHAGTQPTLIYLPGIHGDWTLAGRFRRALGDRAGFVEFNYPRSLQWNLEDYADAVVEALEARGINHGWLIGESFSSQVAWAIGARQTQAARVAGAFVIDGVILAGGFVRYPYDWEVRAGIWSHDHLPDACWRFGFSCLVHSARWLAGNDPAIAEDVVEFVARRTPEDLRIIRRRMEILLERDLRPAACAARMPVYQLTARGDFIVPWGPVRRWLRAACPGYRSTRVVPFSSHSVLFSRPALSVEQILVWVGAETN